MAAVLRAVVVGAVLLALAWAIGSLPGTFVARSGPYTVQTSVPGAILAIIVIVALLTALLRFLSGLRRAPGGISAWRGGRRARLGEVATQRGLVALAAGDATGANAEAGRARKLLGDTPLALLLTAESARLSGRNEEAAAAFAKLTEHKDMAFLGHRGLLRHRLDAGDHAAADAHAQAAEASYPNSAWLREQRREIAVGKQDWPAALGYARGPAETAAFAAAASAAATDPDAALRYGKQAVKADPKLAPAVVAYAAALRKTGQDKAARKALLAGWAAAPQPEIAESFLQTSASPLDRARAAADLAAARPGHLESELLLAQTALAARLTGEAQRHAEAAAALVPGEPRAAAVLAALLPHDGAVPAIASAAPVAGGPRWECAVCHTAQPGWQPVCPHCGKAGSLAWTVPPAAVPQAANASQAPNASQAASGPVLA